MKKRLTLVNEVIIALLAIIFGLMITGFSFKYTRTVNVKADTVLKTQNCGPTELCAPISGKFSKKLKGFPLVVEEEVISEDQNISWSEKYNKNNLYFNFTFYYILVFCYLYLIRNKQITK